MARSLAAARLASWVGKLGRGSAVLRFGQERLVLHVDSGAITSVEGNDGDLLASAFGLPPEGDWFSEARLAVSQGLVTAEEAAVVLKRALTSQLKKFFLDPEAELEVFPGEPRQAGGFVISYPLVVYELVLREGGEALVPVFLPDPSAVLTRLPGFSRWLANLGLPEEALAILAKVNDARSAEAIAEPSPHGRDTVFRFLGATVGAGLVEAELPSLEETEIEAAQPPEAPRVRRRWWLWAVFAALVLAGGAFFILAPWAGSKVPTGRGPWSIAVGGACQPGELEQLYRLQAKDKESLRVVPFGVGGQPCYRLVWGSFATREEAEGALAAVPAGLVQRGFSPHAVLVNDNTR